MYYIEQIIQLLSRQKVKSCKQTIFFSQVDIQVFAFVSETNYHNLSLQWNEDSVSGEGRGQAWLSSQISIPKVEICTLLRGSCHILSVEIAVEYWNWRRIFNLCFLFNFQLKKKWDLKKVQITLIVLWSIISFELRHLNSMKVSRNEKFSRRFFSAEN